MKSSLFAAPLMAFSLVACSSLPPVPLATANLKSEVAAFLDGYLAAISARDAAKIRSAYISDNRFVWIEEGKVRYRQVEDVLSTLATFPADRPIRTELTDLSVVPIGYGAAHAWATFKTTIGDGPRGFSFGGTISFTLERDEKAWRIAGGHTSSPSRR